MHGYYTIRRREIIVQSPRSTAMPVSTDPSISIDPPTNAFFSQSQSTSIVDMSAAFMYVESLAGSVRTNSMSNWPMTDSGCELTVFPSLDLFVEHHPHRTEIITAKADCRIISEIRGTVQLPVLDRMGQSVTLTLSPVLYAPECDIPLLSVDALNKKGYHITFAPTYAGIFRDNTTMIPFTKIRNMWFLPIVDSPSPLVHVMKMKRPDVP